MTYLVHHLIVHPVTDVLISTSISLEFEFSLNGMKSLVGVQGFRPEHSGNGRERCFGGALLVGTRGKAGHIRSRTTCVRAAVVVRIAGTQATQSAMILGWRKIRWRVSHRAEGSRRWWRLIPRCPRLLASVGWLKWLHTELSVDCLTL